MVLEILGSGTSTGVPVPACTCSVCTSVSPQDKRMRACALLRGPQDTPAVLLDAGPEFRLQALRADIRRLDAVLVTHSHADHIHGMDDLRIFSREQPLPVFSDPECLHDIRNRFDYVFKKTQEGGGKPKFELIPVTHGESIQAAGISVMPLALFHGNLRITGWRFGDTAYLTDCSRIPEETFSLLKGIRKLIIDGLREKEHPTHFNFRQAAEAAFRTGAGEVWFTHIGHERRHSEIARWCETWAAGKKTPGGKPLRLAPAWDGLRIPVTL